MRLGDTRIGPRQMEGHADYERQTPFAVGKRQSFVNKSMSEEGDVLKKHPIVVTVIDVHIDTPGDVKHGLMGHHRDDEPHLDLY